MTPPVPWHPAEPELQAYVDGRAAPSLAASVEAHLVTCRSCRVAVAPGVEAGRLSALLETVEDRIDDLERPWFERLLVRLGLAEDDARALLAAPAVRRAWFLAVLGSVALALLSLSDARRPEEAFLLVAPLLPVLATAIAYTPGLDPAAQLVAATPYRTGRLLLARSLAVGATSIAGVALAAAPLPDREVVAAGWLLPSVALTLVALVLASRWGAVPAIASVAMSWAALLLVLRDDSGSATQVVGLVGQLTSVAVGAVAAVLLLRQHRRLGGGAAW